MILIQKILLSYITVSRSKQINSSSGQVKNEISVQIKFHVSQIRFQVDLTCSEPQMLQTTVRNKHQLLTCKHGRALARRQKTAIFPCKLKKKSKGPSAAKVLRKVNFRKVCCKILIKKRLEWGILQRFVLREKIMRYTKRI